MKHKHASDGAAIVDRLGFISTIIETDTDSYRLARRLSRQPAE
ncbi:hypothetical protein SB659_18530 [Arthrobacter sp. SIMBA_036]